MYENIIELENNCEWSKALKEISAYFKQGVFDEKLAILYVRVCIEVGDLENAHSTIARGLKIDHRNPELWLMLGNIYEQKNINQAYLCYENAFFFAEDEEDKKYIKAFMDEKKADSDFLVNKVSFVILSYNTLEYTKGCLESIRKTCLEGSYEIIVVDNASSDGSVEWLKQQEDIILKCNSENVGFPKGCNQGIELADKNNDIFLLNNDTILVDNSLFWLRMGLYENDRVGATGSTSNYVSNRQNCGIKAQTVNQYLEYGSVNNLPCRRPYDEKIYLVGFALLLKRRALEEVGYLDDIFSPGTYEDNDIGLRLRAAGYSVVLCRNSFIYHYGNGGGKNESTWANLNEINKEKINRKWGFQTDKYVYANTQILKRIFTENKEATKILEINCGLGATLLSIVAEHPDVSLYGMENRDKLYNISNKYLRVEKYKDLKNALPFGDNKFDVIILSEDEKNEYPTVDEIKNIEKYLTPDGKILCTNYEIYTYLCASEIKPRFVTQYYSGKDSYSDGSVEDEIIDMIIDNNPEDYIHALSNKFSWPSYYHLIDIRKNILNWYPFEKDKDVLEIGCGLGAITSVLCEKCHSVTAVELSKRRATAALLRNREQENLEIIVGNLNEIKFEKKFDYITLIGVLEYQGKYTNGENPYMDFLKKVKGLLKPEGKLLIAIENQYGLKYWCGAREDHTEIPFNGINQYAFSGKGVKTFSRNGLEKLVRDSGFRNTFFYYPLPDYKLPEKIYSDKYLPKEEEIRILQYYYLNPNSLVADERYIYKDIIENKVFPFFANSFLVECSDSDEIGKVIYASAPILRKKEYALETVISEIHGKKTVEKIEMFPETCAFANQILSNEKKMISTGVCVALSKKTPNGIAQEFVEGEPFDQVLDEAYERGNQNEIYSLWDKLFDNFCEGIIDTIPRNAVMHDNQIVWFDQEWKLDGADKRFIMFRAIWTYYGTNSRCKDVISLEQIMRHYNLWDSYNEYISKETGFERPIFDEKKIYLVSLFGGHDLKPNIEKSIRDLYNLV